MSRNYSENKDRVKQLYYLQISGIVIAIIIWIVIVLGFLSIPWHFLIAALAALVGIYRSYLGDIVDRMEQSGLEGEAGTFHVLAEFGRPISPEELSQFIPHSEKETRYRLKKLHRDGLVGTEESNGTQYYYVLSTNKKEPSDPPTQKSSKNDLSSEKDKHQELEE